MQDHTTDTAPGRGGAMAGTRPAAMNMPSNSTSIERIDAFGANPGALRMMLYVPPQIGPDAALVVVLHGCRQSAEDYADGAGWLELAQQHGFVVLCPEQSLLNNYLGGFNWFAAADADREGGEAESIASMIVHVRKTLSIDPEHIHVTGLSAGGAMAVVMLATYPEVFASGAIIAGLPYGEATGVFQAMRVMSSGSRLDDAELGDLVRDASSHDGPWPTVEVWHGDDDVTVRPGSSADLVRQWADVHGAVSTTGDEHADDGRRDDFWRTPSGHIAVARHRIAHMAHGTALKTDGADGCGAAGPHLIDVGVSSSSEIARGWGLSGGSGRARRTAPLRKKATS